MGDEGFDDPLMAIRFAVPDPPRVYVQRPRLKELLDRGADLPLTLVSAPAGSGKTAMVAAWAAKREASGSCIAWVTFEEPEAPAGAFWSYVQEALHRQGVAVPGVRFDVTGEYSRLLTEIAGRSSSVPPPPVPSSRMVPVPAAFEIVAFVGALRFTVKLSLAS